MNKQDVIDIRTEISFIEVSIHTIQSRLQMLRNLLIAIEEGHERPADEVNNDTRTNRT